MGISRVVSHYHQRVTTAQGPLSSVPSQEELYQAVSLPLSGCSFHFLLCVQIIFFNSLQILLQISLIFRAVIQKAILKHVAYNTILVVCLPGFHAELLIIILGSPFLFLLHSLIVPSTAQPLTPHIPPHHGMGGESRK